MRKRDWQTQVLWRKFLYIYCAAFLAGELQSHLFDARQSRTTFELEEENTHPDAAHGNRQEDIQPTDRQRARGEYRLDKPENADQIRKEQQCA